MDDDVDTWDDDSPPVVLPCPNCGVEVYEEAEQCPSCGEWIVAATGALAGRSATRRSSPNDYNVISHL